MRWSCRGGVSRLSRLPDITVLMMWAGAFLFLLKGERYLYYLGPAFGVSLGAGFVLSAAMGAALGRSRAVGPAVSWIGPTIRALVLVLPLIYAATTGGAVLDSHAFAKRWIGSPGAGVDRSEPPTVDISDGTGDDSELVEAYKAAGPPKIPRSLRKLLGLNPDEDPPSKTPTTDSGKGVVEADLYDLTEYIDRFKGRHVVTEGMVAWDKTSRDRFYLFRFVIVCCVADAVPVAVLVEYPEAKRPAQNTWIRAEGLAGVVSVDGQAGVVIKNVLLTPIPTPEDPYLY